MKNSESTKEHTLEADYLENTTVIDESNLTAEQQLGLKQAEERLERDYISRLEKVGWVIYQIKKKRGVVFRYHYHISGWVVFLLELFASVSFFFIMNHFEWSEILPLVVDWSFIMADDIDWNLSLPFVAHVAFVEQYFLILQT